MESKSIVYMYEIEGRIFHANYAYEERGRLILGRAFAFSKIYLFCEKYSLDSGKTGYRLCDGRSLHLYEKEYKPIEQIYHYRSFTDLLLPQICKMVNGCLVLQLHRAQLTRKVEEKLCRLFFSQLLGGLPNTQQARTLYFAVENKILYCGLFGLDSNCVLTEIEYYDPQNAAYKAKKNREQTYCTVLQILKQKN
ncbi:MAG TPA: hypothetical protein IAD32_00005 [Candidatus Scatavimonas merdigallinarum]|uniref:Uncharacterized protein n=1 Tax=Candidatus Scatavimonas merdigallinarum TaxID=2840914 RepID=A0A9D0ZGD8_9FIRM|nr:hypothetical protein [Candidatus Scatavimonas merdigallinarum]